MISQTAEYSLRAMVFLAQEPETAKTTQQISDATKVPVAYLSKVLQSLNRAGLISSRRGLGGGFCLIRPSCEITVLDIVQAVDPIMRITSCPLGLPEHRDQLCMLHRRLDDAYRMVEESFRATCLCEVVGRLPEERVTGRDDPTPSS